MEDELKDLNQEYDELVKEIDELEGLKAHVGEPGAYYDLVHDLDIAYDRLDYVSRQLEALVAQKRRQEAA